MSEAPTSVNGDALLYVLSLPAGRKVVWDLLALTGLYRQPHIPGNPSGTDFNCGALNVGLALYADCLSISPDLTAMMIKEQGTYDNRDASNSRAERDSTDRDPYRDPGPDEPDLPAGLGLNRLTGRPYDD